MGTVGHPTPPPLTLAELLESWKQVLRAENKAQTTFANYTASVDRYIRWRTDRGENPRVDRRLVTEWVAELLARGLEPATARARQLAVRRFRPWMDGEDTIDYTDQLLGIKPPKLSEKLIQPLTDVQLRIMIAACEGKGLRDRRDEAIIRLMAETGMRAGEVVALQMSDVNMSAGVISIRKTKSGRGRLVSELNDAVADR